MVEIASRGGWSQGYVHDLPYSDHFYPELAPVNLNYVALLNGFAPRRLDKGFTFCELGCGKGQTVTVLAAANPQGRFVACDFNPTHVSAARRWAELGQLDNLEILEKSFAEMVTADLPEFDFIALHGVYSWVSAASRQAILQFISRKLLPGGFVYVSYNCLPGWNDVAPLRHLMMQAASLTPGDTPAKVKAAKQAVEELAKNKSAYLAANPGLAEFIARLAALPDDYFAHEYLNRDWKLFYASDVAHEMQLAKLSYVGSAAPVENHPSLLLSPEAAAAIAAQPTTEQRRLLEDFILNRRFRRDVFTKGALRLAGAERAQAINDLVVGLLRPASEVKLEGLSPRGLFKVETPAAQAVVAALADGPRRVGDLVATAADASIKESEVHRAIHTLIAARQVFPFAQDRVAAAAAGANGHAFGHAPNDAVVERCWQDPDRAALASAVAGTGLPTSLIDRSLLWGIAAHGRDDAVTAVSREMSRRKLRIRRQDSALDDTDSGEREIAARFEHLNTAGLPFLAQLGIGSGNPGFLPADRKSAGVR